MSFDKILILKKCEIQKNFAFFVDFLTKFWYIIILDDLIPKGEIYGYFKRISREFYSAL